MSRIDERVAIVTGSAQGIGRMIALAMANAGAHVVVCDIKLDKCGQVVEEIKSLGRRALAVCCDVTREDDVLALNRRTTDEFNRIDILVNNAGWQYVATIEESTLDQWDKTMAINLRGPFLCSRAVIPQMRKQHSGVIINITSRAGRVAKAKAAAYGASKFGLNGLTQCLALEIAEYGIRVLALAPPHTNTPLAQEIMKQFNQNVDTSKWSDGSDFAKLVAWMASDEASELNGVIVESGGLRP
jgi:NAD(P)-dependent dehydrogenase (short-subunit alcohol dehydrogenase family)